MTNVEFVAVGLYLLGIVQSLGLSLALRRLDRRARQLRVWVIAGGSLIWFVWTIGAIVWVIVWVGTAPWRRRIDEDAAAAANNPVVRR